MLQTLKLRSVSLAAPVANSTLLLSYQQRSFAMSSKAPGSEFEPRQTTASADHTPDPSKSLPLTPQRQALIDDILALYSCKPTIERVKRYTPDCIYDDAFGYADNRYKVAGQWFALPKLFSASENMGYQVIRSDQEMIQFNSEQKWTLRLIPKTITMKSLVSLSLDPETVDKDFMRIKYHKDQANEKDYSHEGLGFHLKKWQADHVPQYIDAKEVQYFEKDIPAAS